MPLSKNEISVGARGSPLSRAQVAEVQRETPHLLLIPHWVMTMGDKDRHTSLRNLEKTDFFTREIDNMQLQHLFRIAVHSAKDLPDPLPKGLEIAVITRGVDSSDSLVYNDSIPHGGVIGTSSERREKNLLQWRPDLRGIDIRGTIEERLALLEGGKVDGVVIAEAALIRLGLTHLTRMRLDGEIAVNQGKLAIISRCGDDEVKELFKHLA